jgi:hypothetical protein
MDLICLKELERVADPRERDPGPGRREDRKYRWAHIYIPSTSIDHAANLVVPARHLKQGQASRTFASWRLCRHVFWSQAHTPDVTALFLHLDMIMLHDWLLVVLKACLVGLICKLVHLRCWRSQRSHLFCFTSSKKTDSTVWSFSGKVVF